MGVVTSGRTGVELDQVPGQPGAREDLNMPNVLDNVIYRSRRRPKNLWRGGDMGEW